MKVDEFGKLVAALRQEISLSRAKLAEVDKTNCLSERLVGKIERGEKANLDSDTLVALANALRLTSLERKEFFHAALGIGVKETVRPSSDDTQIIRELSGMMETLRVPAFLVDVYGDVVRANRLIIRLLNIAPDLVSESRTTSVGFNLMRIIFDEKSGFRRLVGPKNWDSIARHNMQYFRVVSFRHRHMPYFDYVYRNLRAFGEFEKYWRKAHEENVGDSYSSSIRYRYDHPRLGRLDYFSMSTITLTSHGELSLTVYLPAEERTLFHFNQVAQEVGIAVETLASWPQKTLV